VNLQLSRSCELRYCLEAKQAIVLLGEKALWGGEKSEDQPSYGENATSPRCMVMVVATFFNFNL
jgi:hypothetical protein